MNNNSCVDKRFRFAKGLRTMDPFEGYQIIRGLGGIEVVNEKSPTDWLVVRDSIIKGEEKRSINVDEAVKKGAQLLGESAFWNMLDIQPAPEGFADHWLVVDTNMESKQSVWENRLKVAAETGDLDDKVVKTVDEIGRWARSNASTENNPAWDGSVAPYTLFIKHGSMKLPANSGAWNIVGCGFLSGEERFDENVGAITRLSDGTIVMDTLNKTAAPWAEWRDSIGKVVVCDRYTPSSCAYLFDGLSRCAEYDLLGLDTSRSTSLRAMFRGCASVTHFMSTDRFNTANVVDMREMFFGCINALVVNCIGWDLSKVESMSMMFTNSPAVVLFDDKNIPLPKGIDTSRMFDTAPDNGQWLKRV